MASSELKLKLKTVVASLALIPMVTGFSTANAETAIQAMSHAYKHSNVIALEREKLKLTNENLTSAQAGLLPTLNGQLESSFSRTRSTINNNTNTQDVFGARATLSAGMNIWDNGITQNRIQQAQLGQSVQRDLFANAEQSFLLNVFTAYVDVLRDIALLNVQIKEFNVLSEQERAANARFEVGEATATDVSLALAKKTGAASAIAGSKAQLDASRAIYEQHVGHKPNNLSQPSQISRLLPSSERAAIAYAESHHPALKSAKKAVLVAQKDVEIAEAGLLPSAQAFGSASHQLAYDGDSSSTNLTIGARVDIPIFNGGIKHSQVRQAKIKVAQARHDLSIARAQIKAGVKMRWASLKASKQTLVANNAQIKASQAVLNGVRAEADEGVRTSFDVLNSEQQLLSARVQAIVSQRGLLLSEMQLLSAIGKLSLKNLGIK